MADINTLLDEHVTLRYECVDRLLLNGYVPRLQTPEGLARFLRAARPEEGMPRYAIVGERTAKLNREIERFATTNEIPLVHFEKGARKEAVAQPYLDAAEAAGRPGVVLIGIAQERASVFRPPAKREREPGRYGVRRTSAYVNHVYLYLWDRDMGGAFIKLCTYAPWSLRVWLNGHVLGEAPAGGSPSRLPVPRQRLRRGRRSTGPPGGLRRPDRRGHRALRPAVARPPAVALHRGRP